MEGLNIDNFKNIEGLEYGIDHNKKLKVLNKLRDYNGNSKEFEIGKYFYIDKKGIKHKESINLKKFFGTIYVEFNNSSLIDDIDREIEPYGRNIGTKLKEIANFYYKRNSNNIKISNLINNSIESTKKLNNEIPYPTKTLIKNLEKEVITGNYKLSPKIYYPLPKDVKEKLGIRINPVSTNIDNTNIGKSYIIGENGEEIYEGTEEYNKLMGISSTIGINPTIPAVEGVNNLNYNNKKEKNNNKKDKFYLKEDKFTKHHINKDIKVSKNSTNEIRTIREYFNGDENKVKISILNIQKILLKEGKINNTDILSFGPITESYIYYYAPELFKNSDEPIISERANKIISLNSNIDRDSTIREFKSIKKGFKNNPSKVTNSRPAYIYKNGKKTKVPEGSDIYGRTIINNIYGEKSLNNTPLDGTAISKSLTKELNNVSSKSNNIYIFKNSSGKIVLHYYLGGKLRVSTYVSPGNNNNKTSFRSVEKIGGTDDKYHVSFSDDRKNIKYENGKYTGWGMALAINIQGGEYLHVGYVNGKLLSHGCIRVPPFYMTVLANYLGKNGVRPKINFNNNIYN